MKKYNYIIVCALFLALTSCSEFLDIKPIGKVIPTTAEEYRSLLAKAYKTIPSDKGLANFRSDEMKVSADDNDQNSYGFLENWDDASINTTNASFSWQFYYRVIYIANQVIENAGNIKSTDVAVVNQLVGESYLLRAYMHFTLVNLHGEPYTLGGGPASKSIPLMKDADLEKSRFRDTVSDVYASVLSDISAAKELINVDRWEPSFSYRFNKTSVDALESRVNLYMGKWQVALDAAQRVLATDYKLVDMNEELAVLPNHYTSSENIAASEAPISSNVQRGALAPAQFLTKYSEDDLRLTKYFALEAEENGDRKSVKAGSDAFKTTFRLGEFVVTAAEAAAELGQVDLAKASLLDLAKNRYTNEGYQAVQVQLKEMNKDELIDFIHDERARELAFEGHRWFDLRRTTRQQIIKVIDGVSYELKKDDPRYTIPIPRDATQANPNLSL